MNRGTPLHQDDIKFLHKKFSYDIITGKLTNKHKGITYKSECRVQIRPYYSVRLVNLIWMLYHNEDPHPYIIDHIDGNPNNNRMYNLRLATKQQNSFNTRRNRYAKPGIKGLKQSGKKWIGTVTLNGKVHTVSSESREEAIEKLNELRTKLHGEFANNGEKRESSPDSKSIINQTLKLLVLLDIIQTK